MENPTIRSSQIQDAFSNIGCLPLYIIACFFSMLLIRLIISSLKAWSLLNEGGIICHHRSYWNLFWSFFFSHKRNPDISDCWLPAIIGFSELFVYPIVISINGWIIIGAWIGLKTASLFGRWQMNRTAYNFFLLGNILSIVFSFLIFCGFLSK